MGKLTGITVVDLSVFLPGPMMTLMMADQGARVIKVEPPAGDPVREQAPFEMPEHGGQSVWFANLNRGKESVALDLKSDAGKARLRELIAEADVFVEGFRPGAMARLGFDYAAVKALRPDIIYCSISAFGQDVALAGHPAHDMAVQALAGFLSVNDGPDGTPVVPGAPSADMAAGLTALSATLMALVARDRTGEGAYIDCAMFDSLLPWCNHGGRCTAFAGTTLARRRCVLSGLHHQRRQAHCAGRARDQIRAQSTHCFGTGGFAVPRGTARRTAGRTYRLSVRHIRPEIPR